jgi:AraC-like DNA-binding protein
MLDITVEGSGVNSGHEPGFFFTNKGEGHAFWLLMCFRTPFVVLTEQGLVQGDPGDCILHNPTAELFHGPTPGMTGGFVNDWIYFHGTDAGKLISRLDLPCNQIIPGSSPTLLSSLIAAAKRERRQRDPAWPEAAAIAVAAMLIALKRSLAGGEGANRDYQAMLAVRRQLTLHWNKDWTLAEMAGLAGYSVSRFTVLYRLAFATSPIRDLMAIRIAQAKDLLLAGGRSIGQVAVESGFASLHYFSRVFRNLEGLSPQQYLRGAPGRLSRDR